MATSFPLVSTGCAALVNARIPPAAVAETRKRLRANLFDRFPDLNEVFRRPDDVNTPFLGTSVWRRGYLEGLGDAEYQATMRAIPPEITADMVAALIKMYDAAVFGGNVAAAFQRRGWALELSLGEWDLDAVRIVKCDGQRIRVPTRRPQGVEILLSVRIPATYCFEHPDRPPRVFGVPCRDPLDVLMVQIEHQLVHVVLLVEGCVDAYPELAQRLAASPSAADPFLLDAAPLASGRPVALDDLPHRELMAETARGLFGHTTPLHGAHVWSPPPGHVDPDGADLPSCCMEQVPRETRAVTHPSTTVPSVWTLRAGLRRALARATVPVLAAVFDVPRGVWRAGWRVLRVSRWYAQVVHPDCNDGRPLYVPLAFVRPYATPSDAPRLSTRRQAGGYYAALPYDTLVVVLPPPEEDMARTSAADEEATVRTLRRDDAEAYIDAMTSELPMAYFAKPRGAEVEVHVMRKGRQEPETLVLPVTRILPFDSVASEQRALNNAL